MHCLFVYLFVCLFLQKLADFFWVQRLIPREATPLAFMQATHAPPLASRNPAVVHAPNPKFFCWRSLHCTEGSLPLARACRGTCAAGLEARQKSAQPAGAIDRAPWARDSSLGHTAKAAPNDWRQPQALRRHARGIARHCGVAALLRLACVACNILCRVATSADVGVVQRHAMHRCAATGAAS